MPARLSALRAHYLLRSTDRAGIYERTPEAPREIADFRAR